MTETFAHALHRFRVRQGLNKADLAEMLGAGRSSIVAWEAGKRVPRDRARLLDIAQVLQLTLEETDQLIAAARHHRHLHDDTTISRAQDTPAAPSLIPVLPHHMRPVVADFVGRTEETMRLVAALQAIQMEGIGAAIIGVRGMGGIGKTELAYHLAGCVCDTFPDAQIVLDLRGSSAAPLTAAQAMQAVIHAFAPDTKLPDDASALEQHYRTLLHGRRVLILADDAYDAAQVRPLLPTRGCALLMTSRQRFTLPGMVTVDLAHLDNSEAVTLLRGICARLTVDEARAIARVCGSLPLALRISGSILHNDPALSVAIYMRQLMDERLRLAQLRDPDDPHLDVEASLALSYVQLDAPAQTVFRQLGVLVADFTTALALAIVDGSPDQEVVATLHQLLRRNLIMYDIVQERWRLHDLVRDLARHELETRREAEATQWRYARAAVSIAKAMQAQYQAGGDGVLPALAQFDAERPHIDAGRCWAVLQAGTSEGDQLLLNAAAATRSIGELRYDARRERIPQWERAQAAAQRLGDRRAEAQALNNLGVAYLGLGEARHAIPYYERVVTIAQAIGDRHNEGQARTNLGTAYAMLGDIRRAIPYYEEALIIFRATGDQRLEGSALGNLGAIYKDLGDTRRAIPYLEQQLTIVRMLGDRQGEGSALSNLGNAFTDLGEARRAIPDLEQALTITRALGDRQGEAITLNNLGNAYTLLGDFQRAIAYCEEARSTTRAIEDRWTEGYALSYLARAHVRQGDLAHATAVFEQAVTLFRDIGDRRGEAEGQWLVGLALVQQGACDRALPLLRAAVAYEQEIGHVKAAEHAALLARLEAGGELPLELLD